MGVRSTFPGLKGRYPWRIGVPSFVLPTDVVTNVRFMADKVDDVQLLFFESAAKAELPHPVDVQTLQKLAEVHNLTYTVHLPNDIRLGANDVNCRRRGLDEIERLINDLAVLSPRCFDLHLPLEQGISQSDWQHNIDRSLEELSLRLGGEAERVGVENTDYELDLVWPLIRKHGLGICLDLGHTLFHGHDWRKTVDAYLPHAMHVHFHGIKGGKDHREISAESFNFCSMLGTALQKTNYNGTVTLELYAVEQVQHSLTTLKQAWGPFERQEKGTS